MTERSAPKHAAPKHAAPGRTAVPQRRSYASEEYAPAPERRPAPRKSGVMPLGRLILCEILLTGLVLCVFAFFHHVLPRIQAKSAAPREAITAVSPVPTATPEPTSAPTVETETAADPQPTPTPDPRTPWQIKFEDKFTPEVVQTDTSYSSPNISVTLTTHTYEYEYGNTVYYLADIYVGQIENFQTYFALGEYGYYFAENAESMARSSGALVAINGDYCNNQTEGFLVRNGEVFFTEQTWNDIAVLYYDGTFETYHPDEYVSEELLAKAPYQSWKFGPALLDHEGHAIEEFENNSVFHQNPRSALGYYEPGHYCFFLCDGRQDHSRGLDMVQLAKLMEELGCVRAYNMDGGASAVMTWNGSTYNRPSNGGRDLGDILLIKEIAMPAEDENGGEKG